MPLRSRNVTTRFGPQNVVVSLVALFITHVFISYSRRRGFKKAVNIGLHFSDSHQNETEMFRRQLEFLMQHMGIRWVAAVDCQHRRLTGSLSMLVQFNRASPNNYAFLRDITPQHFQVNISFDGVNSDFLMSGHNWPPIRTVNRPDQPAKRLSVIITSAIAAPRIAHHGMWLQAHTTHYPVTTS